jgi:curli biogenesis system outer membrane secretion channel CsgG
MKSRVAAVAAALALQACATVSEKPQSYESTVPKAEQVVAQEARKVPVAAKRYKTKLAIGRFTNETNYGRSLLNDADLDRIGKQASDMLSSRLVLSNAFIVLERPDLAKLQRERELAGGAAGAPISLVGADTLVMGSVTEFGRSVGGKVGFLSSTKLQIARAKVDIRLVDARTGHAYFSAIGAGEASTESGEVAGFGSRAAYDATLNDRAISAAVSDVVDRLIAKLQERPWRTDILEVQGTKVFVSGGKTQGLKEGDALAVMLSGGTVKSQQTGFEIALPPTQVATLKVAALFGDAETSEGAVCEITSGTVDKAQLQKLFVTEPAGVR